MTRPVSLAHLTVLSLPPPDMIEVAARTGYNAVGLRLIAVTHDTPGYPLMQDKVQLRATRAALAQTGLRVNDIEFVKITPELEVGALEPFLATGAELGAKFVIAAPYDDNRGRLADKLSALAVLGSRYNLTVLLEFFPWTSIATLEAASRVARATACENVGVLLDTLHFSRSGGTAEQLQGLPARLIPFAHLCDASACPPQDLEGMLHTARRERLPPGLGGLDLARIVSSLPPDIPLGLEVPMESLSEAQGPEAVARTCRMATKSLLGF